VKLPFKTFLIALLALIGDRIHAYMASTGLVLHTLPTNTYTRYTAATNVREELIEKITLTQPWKTPVLSMAGTATADNNYTEWQRDSLRSANKDNAALDGDDATASAKTPPTRVGNYCQIFQDTVTVSGRAEVVKKAGMKSAMAYHVAKAYKELHRDQEAALLSANPAVAGSAGVAPKAGGLGVLIYTNAQHGAGGSTVAHTSGAPTVAPTAGTGRALTEALFKAAVQATYISNGEIPPAAYMSPNHKAVFSGFGGIAVNRFQVADKKNQQAKIIGGADVYGSDFGDVEIVPHYLLAGATTVYGLAPEYIDVAYLRGYQSTDLGITGDNKKKQVIVDCTFRTLSENAHWKIADLTGG
jgi:hypothetical protein